MAKSERYSQGKLYATRHPATFHLTNRRRTSFFLAAGLVLAPSSVWTRRPVIIRKVWKSNRRGMRTSLRNLENTPERNSFASPPVSAHRPRSRLRRPGARKFRPSSPIVDQRLRTQALFISRTARIAPRRQTAIAMFISKRFPRHSPPPRLPIRRRQHTLSSSKRILRRQVEFTPRYSTAWKKKTPLEAGESVS